MEFDRIIEAVCENSTTTTSSTTSSTSTTSTASTASTSSTTSSTTTCPPVAAPSFSPESGTQVGFPLFVAISTGLVGGHIHYTTDGSDPDENSPIYGGPISIPDSQTLLKAIACTPPVECAEC